MMTAVNKHLICSYTLMNTFICEREAARKAPKTWWPVLQMRLERDILFILYTYSYFVTCRWGKQMENLSNSLRRFKTWRNLFFHGHLRCVWHEWKYRLTAQICAYCTSKPEDGATHPTDFLSLHNLWLMDSGGKQQSTFTQVLRCGTILSYFFLSILEYLDSILWFYIVLFILHLFESCTISYCADTCKGVFLHCHTAIFT